MRWIQTMAAAALLAAACGRKTPCNEPDEVVSSFFTSMMIGDTEMAYQLVSGEDRRVLADRARGLPGPDGTEMKPHEMLVPGLVAYEGDMTGATFRPVKVEVGDVKEVEVTFPEGGTRKVPVVREAGCYRIRLGIHDPQR
jgi:hypothetical protein